MFVLCVVSKRQMQDNEDKETSTDEVKRSKENKKFQRWTRLLFNFPKPPDWFWKLPAFYSTHIWSAFQRSNASGESEATVSFI